MYKYPKIGIRPIIDGRLGGVRESLEETTMNMARSVAALFRDELKYPDGTPVECIIADRCIGGVKEATDCARNFDTANVGVSLSVTPCWCYGTETIDILDIEKGMKPRMNMTVVIKRADGKQEKISVICRIDTSNELEYYNHGGILQYVLRNLV